MSTETRAEWAARNAAYAAAHPIPRPARVLAPALATPVVVLLLVLAWQVVDLDAELGGASSQAHEVLVDRCILATVGGIGCLAASWLTPRDSDAAWLRTAFALLSLVVVPVTFIGG